MQISNAGINFIGEFESFIPHPYLDSAAVPTIGYGTTIYPSGKKVTMKDKNITKEQALAYKKHHIDTRVLPYIKALVKPELNQAQIDSLASLIYNIGAGNFQKSKLLESLNADKLDCDTITKGFLGWTQARVKGKLVVLKGLVNRRTKEAILFCTGNYI